MTDDSNQLPDEKIYKNSSSTAQRLVRLIGGVLDPRAYLHAFRLINYYNYAHVKPRRSLKMGANPAISPNAVFANAERITVGDNLSLGSRCHLWAGPENGHIRIGDNVLFGPEVMVTAATYRFNDGSPVTKQAMDEGDISIGDDAWLGTRVIVLPGVTIGKGAIIGAGALVRDDVPDFAIAVGTPARVVGYRDEAGRPA